MCLKVGVFRVVSGGLHIEGVVTSFRWRPKNMEVVAGRGLLGVVASSWWWPENSMEWWLPTFCGLEGVVAHMICKLWLAH